MIRQNDSRLSSGIMIGFLVPFFLVFFAIVSTVTVVTFILPEAYSSGVRIKLDRTAPIIPSTNQSANAASSAQVDSSTVRTELAIIQSELVLDPVIDDLDLNEAWSKKYNSDTKFRTAETGAILRHMIEVRPVENTSLIDVTVFSDDKNEAARIANAIAGKYQLYIAKQGFDSSGLLDATRLKAEIIDHAEPSNRPVRPDKPLNITLGVVFGIVCGVIAGGIVAAIVDKIRRNRQKPPPGLPHP